MRIAGKRPKPPILLLIPYTYLARLLGFGPISSYLGLGMILLFVHDSFRDCGEYLLQGDRVLRRVIPFLVRFHWCSEDLAGGAIVQSFFSLAPGNLPGQQGEG